ncbi:TlpA family protein disulfide reductase [Corallibacter sp.]|uniref:TlpA family protein disulfide reductase n=1 Tax=Corallibacter sp. TaxID=2038084 RepID=UPI003AB457C1
MKKHQKFIKLLLIIIIVIGLSNCQKKKSSYEKDVNLEQVNLYYRYKNDTLIKSVLLDETNVEFNNEFSMLKRKSDKEDLNFHFNLETPRLFKFYSFEPMSIPFMVYVTPGDSLVYRLENNTIIFKGTNAAHYNFFKELNDLNLKYPDYDEKLGLSDFIENRKTDYQKRLDFLEEYAKDRNTSNSFYQKIRAVLRFQYINGMLNTKLLPKGAITDYTDYLKDIDVEIFNRNDQDDNVYFQLALTNYIKVITEMKFGDNAFSREVLEFQLNFIEKHLKGETKEYAITKMLSVFNKQLDLKNIDILQDKIDNYLPQIENEKFKAVLQKVNRRLNTINNQLIDKVFSDTLINPEGEILTFKEVLKEQKDKTKIIDFWASWCAPCIKEIKNSYQYRQQLIKEKNISFIYVSIDKDPEKWKQKVEELEEFGMDKYQYLIPETNNSALRTFFNVSSIPHYAILDGKNNVFLMNAPSPGNTVQFNEVINRIEAIQE